MDAPRMGMTFSMCLEKSMFMEAARAAEVTAAASRPAVVPASWPCPLPDPGANAPATKDDVAVGDEGDIV